MTLGPDLDGAPRSVDGGVCTSFFTSSDIRASDGDATYTIHLGVPAGQTPYPLKGGDSLGFVEVAEADKAYISHSDTRFVLEDSLGHAGRVSGTLVSDQAPDLAFDLTWRCDDYTRFPDDEFPDGASGADRAWAERATLVIARVNDVTALRMVPHLAGEPTADGQTEPQWGPVHQACRELTALVPEIDKVASEAPSRYEQTGETLGTFAEQISTFASECETVTAAQDLEGWQALGDAMLDAGKTLEDVGQDLPPDIECPKDAPDRPETCDA